MTQRFEYWIQIQIDGKGWIDYDKYDNADECKVKFKRWKRKPLIFRAIERVITEVEL